MVFGPQKPEFDLGSELEFEEYAPQLRQMSPRLRPDVQVIPQTFRGKTSFVLQDPITLQFYRIAEREREVLGQLDSRTTLGEIHDRYKARLGSQAPAFRELADFALRLRQASLTLPEEGEEARWSVERARKRRQRQIRQRLASFMYITLPLLDPDRFLDAALPGLRWAFTRPFFLVWLLTVGAASFAFFYNFEALAAPANGILAPSNLGYLWLSFFLIKAAHEFGHAFLAKNFGAEIHRMGVMFLVFMPCWYVDATPIWAFPRKGHRILVSLGGMLTELFLASLALFAWLALDPGVLRAVLYDMIFVASVSTVIFNGNPLLRYDAYYVLADLIEIPNLRQRSSQYLAYLVRRHLMGEKLPRMAHPAHEKAWFVGYGIASTLYQIFVVVGIVLYIASSFFFLGIAIAAVVTVLWIVVPLGRLVHYVFFARTTRSIRGRAIGVFTAATLLTAFLVGGVPISTSVRVPCALDPAEQQVLRAGWPGFLSEVYVKDGERVRQGQLLARMANDELDFQIRQQELRLQESAARLRRLEAEDLAAAQAEAFHRKMLRQDLATLLQRKASQTPRAPFDGQVIAPDLDRVRGRFLQLGEALFAVASLDRLRVLVVVDNADVVAVKGAESREVRLKFRSDPASVYLGRVERVYPSATHAPPPLSLTAEGGGPVLLEPGGSEEQHTILPWVRVDIILNGDQERPPVGATGTARFITGKEPIGKQLWLKFRRMLHRRFLV